MKKGLALILLSGALWAAPGFLMIHQSGAQTRQVPAVRSINITGEIARSDYGYIIRGRVPAEIFSILNPEPAVLDALVEGGKTVRITARIVSGDNVEIEKIDGKPYNRRPSPGR